MVSPFWDWGYGGTNGEVNQWSIAAEATLLGAAKRMRSSPFTHDQMPGTVCQLIMEKGAAAQYWAKKSVRVGATNVQQYAMANRNALGRVVLMQTTNENFGPGKFTLVTRNALPDTFQPAPLMNSYYSLKMNQLINSYWHNNCLNDSNSVSFASLGPVHLLVHWKHVEHWARSVMAPNLDLEPHFINLISLKCSTEDQDNVEAADRRAQWIHSQWSEHHNDNQK